MAPRRRRERANEAIPVADVPWRIVPYVLVGSPCGRPRRRISDVRTQGDSTGFRQIRKHVQPVEVVVSARWLVVVPTEAAAPRRDAELAEQVEVIRDIPEVVALVVILEDAEVDTAWRVRCNLERRSPDGPDEDYGDAGGDGAQPAIHKWHSEPSASTIKITCTMSHREHARGAIVRRDYVAVHAPSPAISSGPTVAIGWTAYADRRPLVQERGD